ncbi:Transposon Ty3-I Gag-Pol polyprotein like [Argiope bruennichi]|uniref:Transposon Ty3-I Gag-Pol polyprotein like n=1 Tax=Argiope bruennichi TaxID=94029 RepID=A0A8T0FQT9_ARGBR|nr:Transposon Ty3-I Gag-Pol polyprotein like [Argiope bruennichi]
MIVLIRRLSADESLGDRKPSELLRIMKRRAESHNIDDSLLFELFNQATPVPVQTILASISPISSDKAADVADRILDINSISISIISSGSERNSSPVKELKSDVDLLRNEIKVLRKEVADLRRSRRRFRFPSREGIKPLSDRVKCILEFPQPTTLTQLRRYLGLFNFYRRCIPKAADILEPIVCQSNTPWSEMLWLEVLTAALIGCCYKTYIFMDLYLRYPVVVNLNSEQRSNPAVTICNLNRMKSEYQPCLQEDKENGINVVPGYEIHITLKMTLMRRLPAPYKDDCVNYGGKERLFEGSQTACMKVCIQEYSYDKCGCVELMFRGRSFWRLCDMTHSKEVCYLDKEKSTELPCHDQVAVSSWPSRAHFSKRNITAKENFRIYRISRSRED